MKSLMGGNIYSVLLDDWEISWESQKEYRHWCIQKKTDNKKNFVSHYVQPREFEWRRKEFI